MKDKTDSKLHTKCVRREIQNVTPSEEKTDPKKSHKMKKKTDSKRHSN